MKLPRLLAYGLTELPLAMIAFAMAVYVPAYYLRDLELPLVPTALILLGARWFDVITDPLVGCLSDHTRSRWGRRRPWILLGAPLLLLGVVQVFTPQSAVTPGYVALWTLVLWLGWTLLNIPYHAWGAELSRRYHERTRIASFRTQCSVAGVLLAVAAPAVAGQLFGYGSTLAETLTIVAVAAVALTVVAVTWLLSRVEEPRPLAVRRVPLSEGFRIMWRNRPFRRLLAALMLTGAGPAVAAPLFVLFVDHAVGADVAVSLTLVAFYAGNLVGVALWAALAQRWCKRRAWMTGMAVLMVSQPAYLLLGAGDTPALFALLVVSGVGSGSLVALPYAMKADVVDLDRLASGADRTGLLFSVWSLAQKAAASIGMAAALFILWSVDYSASGGNDPTRTWALRAAFAVLPSVCYAAALLVIRPYPIGEERQRLVLRELAARAA